MPITRDLYNYHRVPKAARIATMYPPSYDPGPNSPIHPEDIHIEGILAKPFTPDQRDGILLRTAKAERAPVYIEHDGRPYPTDAHPMAVRSNNLGVKYLDFDLPKAFRSFLDAIEIDEQFALAHNNLGLARLELGDLVNALHDLEQAIALDETLDAAYTNRGLTYLELDQPEAAYRDFRQAMTIAPYDAIHYNNAGILFLDVEEPGTAIRYFDEAIRLNPQNPTSHRNRALALQEMGSHQEARFAFDTADNIEDVQLRTLLETS